MFAEVMAKHDIWQAISHDVSRLKYARGAGLGKSMKR